MRRISLAALSLLAMAALIALTAAPALAGAPEIGHCNGVGNGNGKYKNSICTQFKAGGPFAWTGGFASGIEVKGNKTILRSPSLTVECQGAEAFGAWLTPKTNEEFLELTNCESGGKECTSDFAGPGEIITELLGTLVWESRANFKVALDLRASPGNAKGLWADFTCGVLGGPGSVRVQIKGSVLANLRTNHTGFENTEEYVVTAGKQVPESYVTSGFFGTTVKDTLEMATGTSGDCIDEHPNFGFNWTNASCTAESHPPHRSYFCRVAEEGCEVDHPYEPATLSIEEMEERHAKETAEINSEIGAFGHVLIWNSKELAVKELAHVSFSGGTLNGGPSEVVLIAGGLNTLCKSMVLSGTLTANAVKKSIFSVSEGTLGGEEGGTCISELGPASITLSGLPWKAEFTAKGTVTIKGTKKVIATESVPSAGVSCVYEAAKLSGGFETLLPAAVSIKEQSFKKGKKSSGACPATARINAILNLTTSEGDQLEAELQ